MEKRQDEMNCQNICLGTVNELHQILFHHSISLSKSVRWSQLEFAIKLLNVKALFATLVIMPVDLMMTMKYITV